MADFVAPGFEPVRDAFAADPRGGSALVVLQNGETVVDLREGWRDSARTRPWDDSTLVNVYSAGKPIIALAALMLTSLDVPVSYYWPEFTSAATVRQVLSHTAGLPLFPVPRAVEAWADWDLLCADLAAAPAMWPPGTVAAEHALTYGHLLGEIVRRVDGRAPAEFVAAEIARPYHADFGFGLSAADGNRCAELEFDIPARPEMMLGEPGSLRARAVLNPPGARDLSVVNSPMWRSASVPAVNVHATAMGLARFYQELMTRSLGATMAAPQFEGEDLFVGRRVVWGLGVQIEPDGTWGMGGLGGNAAWVDPGRSRAIGYVTRRLGDFTTVDRIERALALSRHSG